MKTRNFKLVLVLFSILALLAIPMTAVKAKPLSSLPSGVEAVLLNYSQYVKTGTTARKGEFSPQMDNLASERQEFYKEFFAKGLHANLITINSQFITDQDITVIQRGNVYFVNLNEKVTMVGDPITTSPEDYPLIQAAKWALNQTDNENIKAELNRYIESMTRGVNKSVQDGVEIVFWNKHNIEIKEEKGQFQIIKDTFTDKAPDNGKGFDNVIWAQGKFTRGKPSWDSMIDYKIYNTSIEAIGQNLLTDFQPSADGPVEALATVNYFRWNARSYAVYWSSNPPATSQCGTTLRRDTTKWKSLL